MIKPTPGRVVWFTPTETDVIATLNGQPLAAIVAGIFSDTCVNLAVFDAAGNSYSRTSVTLLQDGDERPRGYYCEWMPYQKNQAAKAEAAEAAAQPGAVTHGQTGDTMIPAAQDPNPQQAPPP